MRFWLILIPRLAILFLRGLGLDLLRLLGFAYDPYDRNTWACTYLPRELMAFVCGRMGIPHRPADGAWHGAMKCWARYCEVKRGDKT